MTTTNLRAAGLLTPTRDAHATDAELLGRFVAHRDAHAFAALVTRHGPMVFGVCLRVLRHRQDAEDAFQAAFLVLARRAADVEPPDALAGWLHGVAYRVAKGTRRADLRRLRRERPTADLPEAPAEPRECGADLRDVLDGELRKLPAKYRDALVACDLEGRKRAPVAEAMGIPEGTLSSRLAAARRMLANRLTRRGISFPAALAGLSAAVPPALAAQTAALASPAAVPPAVAALSNGVCRTMFAQKVRSSVLVLGFVLAAALAGRALLASPANPGGRAPNAPAAGGRAADDKAAANNLRELEALRWNLLRVEVEARTLHISDVPAERAWGRGGVAEHLLASADAQISLRGLPVAKDAKITLDGKEVALKDLHAGVNLALKFAGGKLVVSSIEATTAPRAGYVVKEVDADKGTITVTRGKDGKPMTLAVAADALLEGGALKDVKAGAHVQLHVEVENGEMIVRILRVR